MIRPFLIFGATLLGACGAKNPAAPAVSVNSGTSESLSAGVGAEIDITLQTIGPGEFASPPAVSSPSVQFLTVAQASVVVPAGPTQIFRFRAVAPGQAIVVFTHTGQPQAFNYANVADTIVVR